MELGDGTYIGSLWCGHQGDKKVAEKKPVKFKSYEDYIGTDKRADARRGPYPYTR